jgi:hypothetical protein
MLVAAVDGTYAVDQPPEVMELQVIAAWVHGAVSATAMASRIRATVRFIV